MEPYYEVPESFLRIKAQLEENSSRINEIMAPILEVTQKLSETLQPLVEVSEAFQERINVISRNIVIPDSIKFIGKLREAQYVLLDQYSNDFFCDILNCNDTNAILLLYESKNNFENSRLIIEKCKEHSYIRPYELLFSQSVDAYYESKYNLAAVGFIPIIDAVLTEATGNTTHKVKDRYKQIIDKLLLDETVLEGDHALFRLSMTVSGMVTTFYKTVDFSDSEPITLNRHWIMHGRSISEKSKLDCIKIIRLLCGLILLGDIVNEKPD